MVTVPDIIIPESFEYRGIIKIVQYSKSQAIAVFPTIQHPFLPNGGHLSGFGKQGGGRRVTHCSFETETNTVKSRVGVFIKNEINYTKKKQSRGCEFTLAHYWS